MKKMTLKEFKEVLSVSGFYGDSYEDILNMIAGRLCEAAEYAKKCKNDTYAAILDKYFNRIYDALDERGYYDDQKINRKVGA